jgi:hypothetical protein
MAQEELSKLMRSGSGRRVNLTNFFTMKAGVVHDLGKRTGDRPCLQ